MDVLEDSVIYKFTASDGAEIELRRMSDRQRTRFYGFTANELQKCFLAFSRLGMRNWDVDSQESVTVAEIQPVYDRYRNALLPFVVNLLINPDDEETIRRWDHPGDWQDLAGLLNRIVEVEAPESGGTTIPMPDKVDNLPQKEVERLGESSAPASRRGSGSRSKSAAVTSSNGVGSTLAEKPVI
jgi:hypothetical protein